MRWTALLPFLAACAEPDTTVTVDGHIEFAAQDCATTCDVRFRTHARGRVGQKVVLTGGVKLETSTCTCEYQKTGNWGFGKECKTPYDDVINNPIVCKSTFEPSTAEGDLRRIAVDERACTATGRTLGGRVELTVECSQPAIVSIQVLAATPVDIAVGTATVLFEGEQGECPE